MFKTLSKSTKIMFTFDLFVIVVATIISLNYNMNVSCNLYVRVSAVALVVIAGLFSLFLKGNYKIREFNISLWNIYRLFEAVIFAHIPTSILLFFFVSKTTLLKFSLINIVFVFFCLFLYRLGFHYYLFNLKKVKKVLIIGANDRAKAIVDVIKNKFALKMEVVGIQKSAETEKKIFESFAEQLRYKLTPDDVARLNERIEIEKNFDYKECPVFETAKEIILNIQKTEPDIVLFTYKSNLAPTIPPNIKYYLMTDFYEMATGKFYVDEDNIPEFAYEFHQKPKNGYKILKRTLDIISSLIILTVTLPITSYIALRVWLTDKGSPFFTQTRVGKDGKTFECYKLRTMYKNDFVPKTGDDVKYAESVKTDDRIIPFCRFVRKARFDEIPQMINVLKGEMSIVGPRAEWADEVKVFKETVPYYSFRQLIVAGWTGWSHINMQPVFSVDEEKERLAYDLYYIKHRNIFWDISILIKAVFLACGGRHK